MTAKRKKKKRRQLTGAGITKIIVRFILGSVFFLFGFNFSNSVFFHEYPLFGIEFLAEFLLSFAFGAFGFYTVPNFFKTIKNWVEDILTRTVSQIVSDFWEQQSKRMQASRRSRQRKAKRDKNKKLKEKFDGALFLDTSVLIDGRIIDIAKTGFLPELVVLPQSVIDELHLISDNEDDLKRQRGRRGLDIADKLKKTVKIQTYATKGMHGGVDKHLVVLAKRHKGSIMTLDFNLNKVAKIDNIKVLNINDLANAVKSAVLPGEELKIKILQKGKEKTQGVGYLPDGTMIVVENASDMIGKEVTAVVSRLIQSPAGKMIFCKLPDNT